ncbi:MAG TPA: hypothetical protein VF171_05205 [Trueperaceae bacterium]
MDRGPDEEPEVRVIRDEDQTPELLMELFGIGRVEAEFILAIERGELSGDIMEIPDWAVDGLPAQLEAQLADLDAAVRGYLKVRAQVTTLPPGSDTYLEAASELHSRLTALQGRSEEAVAAIEYLSQGLAQERDF